MSTVAGALACVVAVLCAPAPRAFAAVGNGQIAAIARAAGGDRLVVLDPDGGGLRTILAGQRLSSPGWSPDGNRIAVVDGPRVGVLDLVTGRRTPVGQPGDTAPTWSPDGTRLALLRGPVVLTIRLDGTDPRVVPVPFAGAIRWLSWAPDGTRLAYGSPSTLRTVGLDGGGDRELVAGTALGEPAWSPDSTRIAYGDGGRLRLVPAAGGAPADLTPAGGAEPDWAPDGSEIVYAFGAGLRATSSDGAVTRAVLTPADPQTVLAEPDWQPCVSGVTVSCTAVVAAPPSCPEAASVTTLAGEPVELPLAACTDPGGRALSIVLARGPEHGTLTGRLYAPAAGFSGQDAILYRASNGVAQSNLARITIYVVPRRVAPAPTATRRAPYLSALAQPRLDRHGRGRLRVRCDQPCTFALRLVVRLRSRRTLKGPVLRRTLAAGAVATVQLRGPARRRARSAWVTGSVANPAGLRRTVRFPVNVR